MPRAQFTHHVQLPISPPEAWELLQEPDTWASLGPVERVWDPRHEDGILCRYHWQAQAGPRVITGEAKTRQAVEPELMVVDLDAGEVTGLVTVELAKNGKGTNLGVFLTMETTSLLMSVVFPLMSDVIGREFPGQVDAFAERVRADTSG